MEISPPFLYIGRPRLCILQAAFDDGKAMPRKTRINMAWKVDGSHVYPTNDLREHSVNGCWCRPTDDDGIVVHNSLDARELFERGERKPS